MSAFYTKLKLLWEWIKPILAKESLDLLVIALPIARGAILALIGNTMDNVTKKNSAMAELYKAMVELGYDPKKLSQSLMDLAFNLAFRRLKAEGCMKK